MIRRLTRPEKGNLYYIRKASGGYSTCIAGKPTDPDCDVLANCVGYALGRYHEIAQRPEFDLLPSTNAENLIHAAQQRGLRTGTKPEQGALIVWAKGAAGNAADGAGHVAVVEDVCGTSITTSESGYGAGKPFWTAQYDLPYDYKKGYVFLGFVYQPEPVDKYIRRGERSGTVKIMQRRLIAAGYLRKGEDDGDFGNITFGALLAYQYDHGLTVDGVCGPESCAALGV